MFGNVEVSVRNDFGSPVTVPLYGDVFTFLSGSRPYAARVCAMLRDMYGASLSASLGRTENCCTSSGQVPAITIADSTITPKAIAGSRQFLIRTFAKKMPAQMIATTTRIVLAGMTA